MPGNMNKIKNAHKGETCVLVACGPSLDDVPMDFLKSHITFGVNRCYLKGVPKGQNPNPDNIVFSPRYYVAHELLVRCYIRDLYWLKCQEYFLYHRLANEIGGAIPLRYTDVPAGFYGEDPSRQIYHGRTVTNIALQIIYYMGLETVLIVGLDHTGDVHFHPAYERHRPLGFGIMKWDKEHVHIVDTAFQMCRDAYEADGRRIINLTPGSKCDVFEKQDLELWLTHT